MKIARGVPFSVPDLSKPERARSHHRKTSKVQISDSKKIQKNPDVFKSMTTLKINHLAKAPERCPHSIIGNWINDLMVSER